MGVTDPESPGGSPPVPLRTYLWEEVRRSKVKGGYPWTHLYKPAFDEEEWLRSKDHEYEPITPRQDPPEVRVTDYEKEPHLQKQRERRIIKTENADQVIIPLHGDSDEEYNPDRYVDQEVSLEELPDPEAPSTPTTVGSRTTTGEVNTSQVESSALEHLPLQKSAREATTQPNLGTRIRSQAGRLRTRLQNMPKPKINLPERPKIKMPEKPKFLTERPKIKMPEKPKFLKERPKLKMPDKPKFLTERPKFTMPERPKFLKERPKFKMPERPKFNIDKSKLTMPKFEFMKKQPHQKKQTSSTRRPLKESVTDSMRSSSGSKKNLFQSFKYPTYPRFFSRKKKEKGRRVSTPPPRMETESSIQSSPASRRNFSKWVERYRDIKFADSLDSSDRDRKENFSEDEHTDENPAQFTDGYFPEVTRIEVVEPTKAKAESVSSVADSDKEQQSSGSSSAKRRAGVLEEIDSDEFFLREKGLSREDVDVSRYLSLEIRDAFRSPQNALAKLDADLYIDDYDDEEMAEPPKPPTRKREKAPLERSQSSDKRRESDDQGFNTFPLRPSRRKRSVPASLGSAQSIEKPPRRIRSKSDTRQTSMPSLSMSDEHPIRPKRRSASNNREWTGTDNVPHQIMAQDMEVELSHESLPVAPSRKTRSRGTSLADEDRTSRGVESIPSEIPVDDLESEELPVEDHMEQEPTVEKIMRSSDVDIAGYAVVAKVHKEKEKPPPRPPPPPARKKKQQINTQFKTLKDHGINFFFTYPRRAISKLHKQPIRPVRNYSTLGPSRPPRRNRVFREPVYVDGEAEEIKVDTMVKPEELDIDKELESILARDDDDGKDVDLQSGDVVEKMKGRPLPPPPRPPRKTKDFDSLQKKSGKDYEDEGDEEMFGEDEMIDNEEIQQQDLHEPEIPRRHIVHEESARARRDDFFSVFSQIKPPPDTDLDFEDTKKVDMQQQTSFDIDFQTDISSALETVQQTSSTITEVTVSVQTDPLPDDYIVEETETASQVSGSLAFDNQQDIMSSREIPSLSAEAEIESLRLEELRQKKPEKEEARRQEEISKLEDEYRSTPTPEPSRLLIQPILPEKLHVSELEVEKLNVNEIQAKKIVVSDIDGQTMQVSELSSKAGNLVVNGMELPPDLIQTIVAQIKNTSGESSQQPQLRRVATPPPPIIVSHSADTIDLPSPQTPQRTDLIPKPKTTRSKGRKSPTRVIDDSEDELATIMPQRRSQEEHREERRSEQEEPPRLSQDPPFEAAMPTVSQAVAVRQTEVPPRAAELIAQLLVLWQASLADYTNRFVSGVNSMFPEEGEKRRDAQTAACIILVLIAGLIMLGFGSDNTIHHHHWDYVPPR